MTARIAPDMFPLARQIQMVSDTAKGAAARLAGIEVPSMPDTEVTLAELQQRIAKTADFLNGLKPAQFEGSAERNVEVNVGGGQKMTFKGATYLSHFALPNFYFHLTATYAILRHKGVPLVKEDYLGSI